MALHQNTDPVCSITLTRTWAHHGTAHSRTRFWCIRDGTEHKGELRIAPQERFWEVPINTFSHHDSQPFKSCWCEWREVPDGVGCHFKRAMCSPYFTGFVQPPRQLKKKKRAIKRALLASGDKLSYHCYRTLIHVFYFLVWYQPAF